jgi:DNA polymerase-1
MKTEMVLQVHDELVFEVPETELPEVKDLVIEAMQRAADLLVPLTVDVETGQSWGGDKWVSSQSRMTE